MLNKAFEIEAHGHLSIPKIARLTVIPAISNQRLTSTKLSLVLSSDFAVINFYFFNLIV